MSWAWYVRGEYLWSGVLTPVYGLGIGGVTATSRYMRQLLGHGADVSVKCKMDGIHGISMGILLTVWECLQVIRSVLNSCVYHSHSG